MVRLNMGTWGTGWELGCERLVRIVGLLTSEILLTGFGDFWDRRTLRIRIPVVRGQLVMTYNWVPRRLGRVTHCTDDPILMGNVAQEDFILLCIDEEVKSVTQKQSRIRYGTHVALTKYRYR